MFWSFDSPRYIHDLWRWGVVHKHFLILPMSSGHKLVPLSRWGALLGETKRQGDSYSRGDDAVSRKSLRMGCRRRHLDLLTLMVDEVFEPPFCSHRLFLLMSPATISWGWTQGRVYHRTDVGQRAFSSA